MNANLNRLLAWASPAFPVGTFAFSAGLEAAIATGRACNAASLRDWIEGNLEYGAAHNDAVLLACACRAHEDAAKLKELAQMACALTPARQRHEEMLVTGRAFIEAARAWPNAVFDRLPADCPYPVVFGAVAGANAISCNDTLVAFLTAYVQAQISVAVRIVPLGQSDGLAVLAALEPLVTDRAAALSNATLDDIGSCAYAADIAAMQHETLETRIFRS